MQQKGEEPVPLFYNLLLPRIAHLESLVAYCRTIQLVLKKKTWAAIGSHLKCKKGNYTDGVVRLRKLWNRESRELKRIKHLPDEELECPSP